MADKTVAPASPAKKRVGKPGTKSLKVTLKQEQYDKLVARGKVESEDFPRDPHVVLSILISKHLDAMLDDGNKQTEQLPPA